MAVIGAAVALMMSGVAFSLLRHWRKDVSVVPGMEAAVLAPQFALKDYGAGEVHQHDFLGTPALIYVWASWCPLCTEGLENLAAMKKEFGGAIAVVAINREESRDVAVRASARSHTATGTIFLLDPDDTYYRAIGGFSMPETIFVDRTGMIIFHTRGPLQKEEIRRRIHALIE